MKRLREKVRDRTGRSRAGTRIEWVIEDLNPILRGWGNYFRTGNAANKFRQVDRYVTWRLKRLLIKKRGRNLRAGVAAQWTEDWFNEQGSLPTPRHHPLPEGCVTMSRTPSVSRVRENRTHGLKGGWGNGPATAPRP